MPVADPEGFIAFQPGGIDENIAVFIQAQIETSFGLTIIPGIRYEWETLSPASNNSRFDSSDEVKNEAFASKLTLICELTDDARVRNISVSVAVNF
ncbi:TonB-dependent receptor [Dinoroseobacter sp. S375]|uniref:TonB-dependent receptor n=1 Tax=Dinoroseobacter sp. S375 TaxID=3415136 RepID=UPI003C7ACFD1